jgi:hypothetical protein
VTKSWYTFKLLYIEKKLSKMTHLYCAFDKKNIFCAGDWVKYLDLINERCFDNLIMSSFMNYLLFDGVVCDDRCSFLIRCFYFVTPFTFPFLDKMWMQFISPYSFGQWIHCFSTKSHLLWPLNQCIHSFPNKSPFNNDKWNHLWYRDTFCCGEGNLRKWTSTQSKRIKRFVATGIGRCMWKGKHIAHHSDYTTSILHPGPLVGPAASLSSSTNRASRSRLGLDTTYMSKRQTVFLDASNAPASPHHARAAVCLDAQQIKRERLSQIF